MSYTKDGHYEGESLNRSELYAQAPDGVVDLYGKIEARMEALKGKGWADAHPGVIAQLVVAATLDFNQAMNRIRFQELEKRLEGLAALVDAKE
ncbi:MAG: hypothetical protein IJV01_00320 [Bacteroidales bacterium]|nr:hypothetical protein [Bacteroidales bacterium]